MPYITKATLFLALFALLSILFVLKWCRISIPQTWLIFSNDATRADGVAEDKRLTTQKNSLHEKNGDSIALIQAVADDNPDLVNFLLEHGANPSQIAGNGQTPLHIAACMNTPNTTEIILLLLAQGADINASAPGNRATPMGTPLAIAAQKNNQKAALLLLSQGADINKADDILGWSPLHVAAHYGHVKMIELLIYYGKDAIRFDLKDKNGKTAFEIATTQHDIHFINFE